MAGPTVDVYGRFNPAPILASECVLLQCNGVGLSLQQHRKVLIDAGHITTLVNEIVRRILKSERRVSVQRVIVTVSDIIRKDGVIRLHALVTSAIVWPRIGRLAGPFMLHVLPALVGTDSAVAFRRRMVLKNATVLVVPRLAQISIRHIMGKGASCDVG